MPRGSKPGERRGGRQRATPNKRTVLTDRILAAASSNPIASSREILLILVKDQALPAATRIAIAQKSFGAGRSRFTDDRSERPVAHDLLATLRTLDLLLRIAQDATATPAERRKAASEAARCFLPKKPGPKKSRRGKFLPDEYGFSVDPNLARELRDAKLQLACLRLSSKKLTPYAVAQKAGKLQARIKEIQELLQCPCPSKYRLTYSVDGAEVPGEIVRDSERLTILWKRHAEKKTFTPEEDLEEAIRMARYDSFLVGPEMAAGKRVTKLREKKRAADHGGPPLTRAEEAALRFLGLLYSPPRRSIDERTPAEHPFWDLPAEVEATPEPATGGRPFEPVAGSNGSRGSPRNGRSRPLGES